MGASLKEVNFNFTFEIHKVHGATGGSIPYVYKIAYILKLINIRDKESSSIVEVENTERNKTPT